ncbi:hypothetical protein [Phnomibacter sp. MR]|uniref:hypothetical protein n=1 Tax=Phnomibacter sp. MR TaxID=3042318 RepID=UPI003A8064E7
MRILIHTGSITLQQHPMQEALLLQLSTQFEQTQWLLAGTTALPQALAAEVQWLPLKQSRLPLLGAVQYKRQLQHIIQQQQVNIVLQCDDWIPGLACPQLWLQPGYSAVNGLPAKWPTPCAVALSAAFQLGQQVLPAEVKAHYIGLAAHPAAQALAWAQREQLKQTHAGGLEYFLSYGKASGAELLSLLKAYSQFRKRQQSSMPLLIALPGNAPADFAEKLSTYKYRSDVQVLPHCKSQQLWSLSAAAYAVLLTPAVPAWYMLSVLKTGTALLTPRSAVSEAACGPAANLLPGWEEAQLAQALMLLYKDETYRNTLLANAQHWLARHPLPLMADRLMQALQTTCEN